MYYFYFVAARFFSRPAKPARPFLRLPVRLSRWLGTAEETLPHDRTEHVRVI